MGADDQRRSAPPESWRARAFGLELELDASLVVAGLQSVSGRGREEVTRVVPATAQQIDAAWPRDQTVRLLEERFPGAAHPERTVDEHPTAGYRFAAAGYGLALVSAGGDLIRLASCGVATWRWQRLLTGRVLPWTALLRGFEVFHASAVEIGGRAIALIGPSGIGKTSLAVQLVLGGAGFVTDDVLAVDRGLDGTLRAHPGTGVAGIRAGERTRIAPEQLRRLGDLPTHEGKSYAKLESGRSPLPLGAICFITRREASDPRTIDLLQDPDPGVLLGSTFVPTISTPRRLENLLDICASAMTTLPTFTARVRPGVDAAVLAQQLRTRVQSLWQAA